MFFRLRPGYTEVNLNGEEVAVQRFLRCTILSLSCFQAPPPDKWGELFFWGGTWEQGYTVIRCDTVEPRLMDTSQQRTPTIYRTILKVPAVLPLTSILKQPLNSGHPATPYNGQFFMVIVDTRQPLQQDCPPSLLELTT